MTERRIIKLICEEENYFESPDLMRGCCSSPAFYASEECACPTFQGLIAQLTRF